jgi:hypothetical protein|tara:strand:- start:890 stop:1069 length:180 start_codon:yes stop_codon:yes gene_type:complete
MILEVSSGENNHQITLDTEKAVFTYKINLNGSFIKKVFPVGTTRTQVRNEVKQIMKDKY